MFGLLASHPNLSMTRRSNMWRYFYQRYGDLASDENLDRCLHDMVHYRKMGHLEPKPDQIRSEFVEGPRTYGRLFEIFHTQHANRSGKSRWGEKSLHNEHFAHAIFKEFPQARIIHMVRDPRDRYASVSRRHGQHLSRVGPVSGRWLRSMSAGLRNSRKYPGRYTFVRYEDLAESPEKTLEYVCAFIGEDYDAGMLTLRGEPGVRENGSNSSFGDLGTERISTKAIGRFEDVLPPKDVLFIQSVSRRAMTRFGYTPVAVDRSTLGVRYFVLELPASLARMRGWMLLARFRLWRGARVPREKVLEHVVGVDRGEAVP